MARRLIRRAFRLLRATAVLVAVGGGFWLVRSYQQFLATPLAVPAEGLIYELRPGASLKAVAGDLRRRGLVERPRFLELLGRLEKVSGKLRAGEYRLTSDMTPRDFLELLVSGKVLQHELTIVEGWSFPQLIKAVGDDDRLTQTLTGLDDAEIMAALGYPGEHPEGRFFPDTYHFPRDTTDRAFLRRAYESMQRQLATAWAQRSEGLPLESPYEALILASIVEKETGVPEERARIAGVFVRRLRNHMRLQTDPTVIYGMGKDFDGNIRRRDLATDTPYNTYTRKGLPPTPIAMPGGAAIEAVMHPAPGKSLYFVARGDGSHHFSETLEEHNAAVVRFQLGGRGN